MTRKNKSPPEQTSMIGAFAAAEFEAKTAHMPDTAESAGPYFRGLIERYNEAMRAGNNSAKIDVLFESVDLVKRLNSGTTFGCKTRDGVCDKLDALVAAADGTVPIWGQCGNFSIDVQGCTIRIEFDGLYGLCEFGFSANAVHWDKPFISDTGYRSFLIAHEVDCTGAFPPVDEAIRDLIEAHIAKELKGKLLTIAPQYRERNKDGEPVPERS